jgi:hypothetical protein
LPVTLDWQPTRSAPVASTHAVIPRAFIGDKATQSASWRTHLTGHEAAVRQFDPDEHNR